MPNLYDLLADHTPEMTESTPTPGTPPTPGTSYTASVETIDNDCSGRLLGTLNI
ncbi:hypothetical protein IAG44_05905 [Streptomyces roseirectus]|uniref:Uncharacterized protein n=1 Tax=Streptomyces roseirectus TaxID=2768066 RepID=A0A7H0I8A9_9ACTN|nr:hypothetical protein [Streptomyces roseirectus]QNP69025.1 hypothetical protein IAG44_05905 [Streptomyces roseirectus]